MIVLPSPIQVAGRHLQVYEAYFKELDPKNTDSIGALTAAKFLKNSGLPDVLLSKIWDLSDPNGTGSLSKAGLFVALKLIALAQNNVEVCMNNIESQVPPPMMGDATVFPPNILVAAPPPLLPAIASIPVVPVDWSMTPMERVKYEHLFESLQPKNGYIPGNKVKGVLMDSKLPTDTLGKIWDLADMDKDGCLDKHEFIVAMHLVYKALEKFAIPSTLPAELLPPSKRQLVLNHMGEQNNVATTTPPPPGGGVGGGVSSVPWVVSKEEKQRYDVMFKKADSDQDGFVSGPEIKHVFLSCNLPQSVLAQIWGLADMNQVGKLNNEQFALAMWLVQQKLKGNELPSSLTLEMTPPSLRTAPPTAAAAPAAPPPPPSNPEMDMINKDIDELMVEKLNLQNDVSQKEADIEIKHGQVKSLQGELDALAATLRQLENQKVEAAKRLTDLKTQISSVETSLSDLMIDLESGQTQVDKVRTQANEQESLLTKQETELNSKKAELDSLKHEEHDLEKKQKELNKKLTALSTQLQDSQLLISQIKGKVSALEEHRRQLNAVIEQADDAISKKDASNIPDSCLNIEPEFKQDAYTRLIQNKTPQHVNDNSIKTPAAVDTNGINKDPFASSDGFDSDPFASTNSSQQKDPFAAAFGSSKGDPFADSGSSVTDSRLAGSKDPFGCDPFSAGGSASGGGGAPPPRPESPSPALPPKKSKQPPPRPAPPRPVQPTQPHPLPTPNNVEFADFDNFNSKVLASSLCSPFSTSNSSLNVSTKPPSSSSNFAGSSSLDRSVSSAAILLSSSTSSKSLRSTTTGGGGGNSGSVGAFGGPIMTPPPLGQTSSTPTTDFFVRPASAAATIMSHSPSRMPSTPTTVAQVSDFTDDPFKDYRYEDPFNIADPFSDEDLSSSASAMTITSPPVGSGHSSKTLGSTIASSLPVRTNPDGSPAHFDPFEKSYSPLNVVYDDGNRSSGSGFGTDMSKSQTSLKDNFSMDPFFNNSLVSNSNINNVSTEIKNSYNFDTDDNFSRTTTGANFGGTEKFNNSSNFNTEKFSNTNFGKENLNNISNSFPKDDKFNNLSSSSPFDSTDQFSSRGGTNNLNVDKFSTDVFSSSKSSALRNGFSTADSGFSTTSDSFNAFGMDKFDPFSDGDGSFSSSSGGDAFGGGGSIGKVDPFSFSSPNLDRKLAFGSSTLSPPPVSQLSRKGNGLDQEDQKSPFSSSSSLNRYHQFGRLNGEESGGPRTSPSGKPKMVLTGGGLGTTTTEGGDGSKTSSGRGGNFLSENDQIEWAAHESLQIENELKKKAAQERADLELAIRLSKEEEETRGGGKKLSNNW